MTYPRLRAILLAYCVSAMLCSLTFASPGDLDSTFGGGDGRVPLQNTTGGYRGVRRLSGGKLVVWGGDSLIIARRYHDDGTLDMSYGYSGSASWYNIGANPYVPGRAEDVELLSDGSMIVVGKYTLPAPAVNEFRPAMWRFGPDGLLDTNFGTDGRLILSGEKGSASELAIRDSKFYVYFCADRECRISRRHSNGGLDFMFGNFGSIIVSGVNDLEIGPSDAKIYTAMSNGTLKRYNSDGEMDTSFGVFGTAPVPQYEGQCPNVYQQSYLAVDLNFAPGGKLLVSGELMDPTGQPSFENRIRTLSRYTNNGFIDNTFNGGDLVCSDVSMTISHHPQGVAQQDGKVLFATGYSQPLFQRRNSNGTVDIFYSVGGNNPAPVRDLLVQPDGKSVILWSLELQRRLP